MNLVITSSAICCPIFQAAVVGNELPHVGHRGVVVRGVDGHRPGVHQLQPPGEGVAGPFPVTGGGAGGGGGVLGGGHPGVVGLLGLHLGVAVLAAGGGAPAAAGQQGQDQGAEEEKGERSVPLHGSELLSVGGKEGGGL